MNAMQAMRTPVRALRPSSACRLRAPIRGLADSAKPPPSGPTPGSPPPPRDSHNMGTSKMLFASAAFLVSASAAFLYLGREQKKDLIGVGHEPHQENKLKGSKHKVQSS